MPAIPMSPEPLAALVARYPRALEHVYDSSAIGERGAIRPGEVAAQVFDFDDGLRLIVSREQLPEGRVLHVSASFLFSGALGEKLAGIVDSDGAAKAYLTFLGWVKDPLRRAVRRPPPSQIPGQKLRDGPAFPHRREAIMTTPSICPHC